MNIEDLIHYAEYEKNTYATPYLIAIVDALNELKKLRMQHISDVGQEQDNKPYRWTFKFNNGSTANIYESEKQANDDYDSSEGHAIPLFLSNSAQSNTDKPLLNQKWSKESEIINQAGFDKLNADKPELTHEKNVQIRKQSFHRFNNSMIGDVDAN